MNTDGKTLHVLHTESIYTRGGEKYLYELLRRITKNRRVRLYLHDISPDWRKRYGEANVEVIRLWKPSRLFWILLPFTLAVNYLQLKRNVRENDVVFATNFPMNFLAVLVSGNTIGHCFEPLAIFYDPVRISSLSWFSRVSVTLAKQMYSHLDRFAYRSAAALTALGPTVEPYILETYRRKPDIYLPNGVDTDFFSPNGRRRERVIRIGHSTDYTIFKGTEDFIAIVAELQHTGISFQAVISESIADPAVKKKYLRMIGHRGIAERIRFVGNIPEQDLPAFYRSLDVFVYTGSPECAGGSTASLSVLESQACGTPVMRSGGDDHEIREGKTGRYIRPHQHRETAGIIAEFLRMPQSDRERMRRACRAYITAHFSWDTTSRVLLRIIRKLERP